MARTYDDISHLRQPYLQSRLGGPQDEAEGLGVYMTSGPVDAAPLPVHTGFGVYETSGPVDAAPLPIHHGFGAATLAAARLRVPGFNRPDPGGGSMHYPVRPHTMPRAGSMHYPVRPHIPPAASYGARMGGAVPMPAPAPAPQPHQQTWCCNSRRQDCCGGESGVAGLGAVSTTTSAGYVQAAPGDAAVIGQWLLDTMVYAPSTPSPDVSVPSGVYVLAQKMTSPPPPGYTPLNITGAAWVAQQVASNRAVAFAVTGWTPEDSLALLASVSGDNDVAAQAAPGGNWAVIAKSPLIGAPTGGGSTTLPQLPTNIGVPNPLPSEDTTGGGVTPSVPAPKAPAGMSATTVALISGGIAFAGIVTVLAMRQNQPQSSAAFRANRRRR